jgi:hypothetical protein
VPLPGGDPSFGRSPNQPKLGHRPNSLFEKQALDGTSTIVGSEPGKVLSQFSPPLSPTLVPDAGRAMMSFGSLPLTQIRG